jgi:hypothetical protein
MLTHHNRNMLNLGLLAVYRSKYLIAKFSLFNVNPNGGLWHLAVSRQRARNRLYFSYLALLNLGYYLYSLIDIGLTTIA